MESRKNLTVRLIFTVLFFIVSSLPVAAGAENAASGTDAVRQEIEARLSSTILEGHTSRDIDKVMSLYAADATIMGYVMGKGNKEKARKYYLMTIDNSSEIKAELELNDVVVDDGVATVFFRLPMQVISSAGDSSKLINDHFFMKMRREEGEWRTFLQSYRGDFGISDLPHGGSGGPAEEKSGH